MVQSTNPYYGHFALLLFLGAVLCLFSAFFLYKNGEQSLAIVLLGFALMLLMMGLRVRPTGKNNREAVKKEYEESIRKMKDYLSGDFPLPPQYAHPLCLEWMQQSILEGKAKSVQEAYLLLKQELKELDSTKQVSQKVYDRIVVIKPMFLAAEYQDSF